MVELKPAAGLTEIRTRWDYIQAGLSRVIAKCGAAFHPADVYRELSCGTVFLYWIIEDGETKGATVVCEHVDKYTLAKLLNLELTFIDESVDYASLRDAVDALARSIGADGIEWFSPRIGWTRKLEEIGFTADCMYFIREVPNG